MFENSLYGTASQRTTRQAALETPTLHGTDFLHHDAGFPSFLIAVVVDVVGPIPMPIRPTSIGANDSSLEPGEISGSVRERAKCRARGKIESATAKRPIAPTSV